MHAPTVCVSLERGVLVKVPATATLADGLAVAEAGVLCVETAKRVVDRMVLVEEGSLATAVLRLLEMEKMVVEGAGRRRWRR